MAIQLVTVMTIASDGDEAVSIFNAAFGNLVGVFISPALILAYLGTKGNINVLDVFVKLMLKVLLPLAIGQALQKLSTRVVAFVKTHKKHFGKAQQYCLNFIIYCVFCKTFMSKKRQDIGSIFYLSKQSLCGSEFCDGLFRSVCAGSSVLHACSFTLSLVSFIRVPAIDRTVGRGLVFSPNILPRSAKAVCHGRLWLLKQDSRQ
jgi:hypothetical protein